MRYGFGVDIGGTTVKIAYFEETGKQLLAWEIPTVTLDGGKSILPDIAAALDGFMKEQGIDRSSIIGIGVGVPGPINKNGVVNRCVNLGWGVFNIEEALSELTGFPVKAGNDANVAAMGEYWQGSGKAYDSLLMATLGTGVGGGIVVDGHMIYGAHGAGGEIGHLTLNRDETESCGCGKRGCVEQYCSATGVVRLAKRRLERDDKDSVLRQKAALTAKDIFDAGKAGDEVALEILQQFFDYLGEFLSNIASVIDPEVIVLGGGVSKAGDFLLEGVKAAYMKKSFHAIQNVQFAVAKLGNDAGSYGAFKLALDAFG